MAMTLGNIKEDGSVSFTWSTTNSSGASATRDTIGTISVRRHDDGTDCTGTSVTDSEDTPDTGLHECIIDTNDNANYTTANDYTVWLDGAIIDGVTLNVSLAHFSIENRYIDANLTDVSGTPVSLDAVVDANVTQIDGEDVTVATTYDANVTEVNGVGVSVASLMDSNVTQIDGDAQSATDLKDFTDTGYDPVAHKVVGVQTTDVNTDMLTVSAILGGVVDGSIDVETALKRILSATSNDIVATGTDPKELVYKDSAGADVMTHSVPASGSGRTSTIAP